LQTILVKLVAVDVTGKGVWF